MGWNIQQKKEIICENNAVPHQHHSSLGSAPNRKYLGLLVHTSDSKAMRAVEEAPCWAGAKAAAPATRAERAASLNMVGYVWFDRNCEIVRPWMMMVDAERSMLVERGRSTLRDRIFQFECSTVDTLKKNLCACPARARAQMSFLSCCFFLPASSPDGRSTEGLHRPAGKKAISYRHFYIW